MKILVTGGAGFIGSHVADQLLAAGHQVVVVDSLWEHGGGRRENVSPDASFHKLDVRDPAFVDLVVAEQPEVISHHAAQHSVKISTDLPAFDASVNILGLINLLTAARTAGTRKVIFASSGATYGMPARLPIDEETAQLPESPYGISKMVSEHYLRYWHASSGLDYTALRYGNVYGPRQDPNGEAGVIAVFVHRFLKHQPVRIDSDGEQTRDYVFVSDVARATLASLNNAGAEAICIGSGTSTSVNQIYKTLRDLTGFEAPITHAPRRPGDVKAALFDVSKARDVLGWTAEVTLADGLRQTIDFFRQSSDY